MSVTSIAKLSDHASVLMRQRDAIGCVILVLERDGPVSYGYCTDGASPADFQDALAGGIIENARIAREG